MSTEFFTPGSTADELSPTQSCTDALDKSLFDEAYQAMPRTTPNSREAYQASDYSPVHSLEFRQNIPNQTTDNTTIPGREVDTARDWLNAQSNISTLDETDKHQLESVQSALVNGDLNDFSSAIESLSNQANFESLISRFNKDLETAEANVTVEVGANGNIFVSENQPNAGAMEFSPAGKFVDKYITRSAPDGRLKLEGPFRGGATQAEAFGQISDSAVRNIRQLDPGAHRNWSRPEDEGLLR